MIRSMYAAVATPPMRPIGTAAMRAPVTELMKSKGMSCGTATIVPHQSKVRKGMRWQRTPNTRRSGMRKLQRRRSTDPTEHR